MKKQLRTYLVTEGKEGEWPQLLEMIREAGGIEYTIQLSKRYLDKAIQSLEVLPASSEKKSLQMMAQFIMERSY